MDAQEWEERCADRLRRQWPSVDREDVLHIAESLRAEVERDGARGGCRAVAFAGNSYRAGASPSSQSLDGRCGDPDCAILRAHQGATVTNEELVDHLEYVAGQHAAHMLVLRLLLRDNPTVADQVRRYKAHMPSQSIFDDWSSIKLQAMNGALDEVIPTAK